MFELEFGIYPSLKWYKRAESRASTARARATTRLLDVSRCGVSACGLTGSEHRPLSGRRIVHDLIDSRPVVSIEKFRAHRVRRRRPGDGVW